MFRQPIAEDQANSLFPPRATFGRPLTRTRRRGVPARACVRLRHARQLRHILQLVPFMRDAAHDQSGVEFDGAGGNVDRGKTLSLVIPSVARNPCRANKLIEMMVNSFCE